MEARGLTLVDDDAPRPALSGRRFTLALASGILALAAVATGLGADRARRPVSAREIGEDTMRRALISGSDDPAVRARLLELRAVLGRRPLDSMTRSVYASLLLSMSRGPDDVAAAVFQIERAVDLAPVTLPVVRSGVLVLAHTGNVEPAVRLVRSVFEFDPEAAASWLTRIEPLLLGTAVSEAIPDEPAAWLAWSIRLDLIGRHAEALDWADRAVARFPDDLAVLERAAALAVGGERWERLAELLPAARRLPETREAAPVLVHRARLRARQGDRDGARADVERALRLDPASPDVALGAGEALAAAGDVDGARRTWTRVSFAIAGDDLGRRRRVLEHLAELEDGHGTPEAALRAWRALAAAAPDHERARRRIDDLTGFNRE